LNVPLLMLDRLLQKCHLIGLVCADVIANPLLDPRKRRCAAFCAAATLAMEQIRPQADINRRGAVPSLRILEVMYLGVM